MTADLIAIVVIFFLTFPFLGEVAVCIACVLFVVSFFNYILNGMSFYEFMLIFTLPSFLFLFWNRYIKFPLDIYRGIWMSEDKNYNMAIKIRDSNISIEHNFDTSKYCSIVVKWRHIDIYNQEKEKIISIKPKGKTLVVIVDGRIFILKK